jgi:hypothetical protein
MRVAQYFFIVMRNYDVFTIHQNSDFIDIFLVGAIEDQNQSVRNQARKCF